MYIVAIVAKRSPISATAEHLLHTYRLHAHHHHHCYIFARNYKQLEMWANAHDGRPAEYSCHPLFNAAKFG